MKLIPIRRQRNIMKIPLVNILNLPICMYNCNRLHISAALSCKMLMYLFGYTIPAGVLYGLFLHIIPSLRYITYLFGMYLVPYAMGYGLIKFQQKYILQLSERE